MIFDRVLNCSSWYVGALFYLIFFHWTSIIAPLESDLFLENHKTLSISPNKLFIPLGLRLLYDAVSRNGVGLELDSAFVAHVKLAQQVGHTCLAVFRWGSALGEMFAADLTERSLSAIRCEQTLLMRLEWHWGQRRMGFWKQVWYGSNGTVLC